MFNDFANGNQLIRARQRAASACRRLAEAEAARVRWLAAFGEVDARAMRLLRDRMVKPSACS